MGLNDNQCIRAEMIIEVMGRPPEHLVETLDKITEEIGKEQGVTIIKKKVNEPCPLKEQPDFYTSFVEIEVEVEEVLHLAVLMFKYMPAYISVISPESIVLTNNGWNEILNELTRRLHGYDEVARILQVEKGILETKLRELMGQNPQGAVQEEDISEEKPAKKSKKSKK